MAVYVDNFGAKFGRMTMCHMMADSTSELLNMADAIGVQRKWLQHKGRWSEHFDICLSKRAAAIALGAIEIEAKDMVRMFRERTARAEGKERE